MLNERTHENLLCGSSGLNLSIIYETANVFMDLIQPTNSWHDFLSVGFLTQSLEERHIMTHDLVR